MPSSGAARVLVVDDEEGVRSFLAEALELAGHDVETAADGVEALARITARPPRVLITDLRMPNLDGMGLLRRVRAEHPEVAVIVLTAYGSVSEAVEAMKEGAFDFLEKPLEGPAALRRVVEHALAQRRAASDDGVADDDGPRLTYGDPAMAPVVRALQKVARTDATVLLIGESGTGKEVAARAVHRWSGRRDGPFIAINCAALADTLLESELFGHEKGAFTGAERRRAGWFEAAHGGTLFLDEIGH
ncbi:MAG: sigma-54-dependent Fis family transcriptional regulator, partial [Myxococcales bacterium]|nr:sigma-54-dependent Fis family transcriptional regulator [Myxococcales bacterium]